MFETLFRKNAGQSLAPIEPPRMLSGLFASVATDLVVPDAVGITILGFDYYGAPVLSVLDWNLLELNAEVLEGLGDALITRFVELAQGVNLTGGGTAETSTVVVDPTGAGQVLAERMGASSWANVDVVPPEIVEVDVRQRVLAASAHLNGRRVKLTRAAYEKSATFKRHPGNHLLRQIKAFGIGAEASREQTPPGALLIALANGIACAATDPAIRARLMGASQ